MGFRRRLRGIYRQPLLLAPFSLGADGGYAASEGIQEGGDGVVEFAHVGGLLFSSWGSPMQCEGQDGVSLWLS